MLAKQRLRLTPCEPEETDVTPVRKLLFMPLAICVRPSSGDVDELCSQHCPAYIYYV